MNNIKPNSRWRKAIAILMLGTIGVFGSAFAELANYPLFLQQQIKPNIMFTLDNSGSMEWATITGTDGLAGFDSTKYYSGSGSDTTPPQTKRAHYSSSWNQIYYNPKVLYTPGVDYKGVSRGNSGITSANKAWIDPYLSSTSKVNISEICYSRATPTLPFYNVDTFAQNLTSCKTASGNYSGVDYKTKRARYAFYYVYDGSTSLPDYSYGSTANPSGGINTNSAAVQVYNTAFPTRVDIYAGTTGDYAKGSERTDCVTIANKCTGNEELQNFANWFSYYRTRILMAKTSMGQVFANLDKDLTQESRFRLGLNTINKNGSSNTDVADSVNWLTIRDNNETQKIKFFNTLYASIASGGTPLRNQLNRVGKLFAVTSSTTGSLGSFSYTNDNPYFLNNQVGTTDAAKHDATMVSCRPNYHILTTDGYWNDSYTGIANVDGECSEGSTCFSTRARGSYDSNAASGTLGDIALHYYRTDLGTATELVNKVPASEDDPQGLTDDQKGRQRMVTFTVGMGANGTLDYRPDYDTATTGDFYDITRGDKNWPKPVSDKPSALDDLWHAAVNGRGKYYKATNPTALSESVTDALKKIEQVTRTSSTETATSSLVQTGTIQFEPSFKSVIWTGTIAAYKINVDIGGTETWEKKWDAGLLLPPSAACTAMLLWPDCRNIATMSEGTPVDFTWANLSTAQKTAIGTENVLNYLRGDAANEKLNGGSFRDRQTKLGDIVNSAPLYVKVGMDQGYSLLPTIGGTYDSFLATKASRKGMIYVGANDGMMHAFDATVDLTNSGKEAFAYVPNAVYANLKDLSSSSYEHRYYVDGQMTEGDAYLGAWKTILLGSTGAGAKSVFAIDITDPTALSKDSVMWEASGSSDADLGNVLGEAKVALLANDTWVAAFGNGYYSTNGMAKLYLKNLSDGSEYKTIATDTSTSNGLSAPALVYDKQNRLKLAYAGDLQGNLWKFDLTSPSAPVVTKLFAARSSGGDVQPIAQRPVYRQHPRGGYMVMFGTGKYFDKTDGSSTDTTMQTMYGVWDKPVGVSNLTRSSLQVQTLTAVTGGGSVSTNAVDWDTQYGWYVDLSLHSGERAIAHTLILEDVFVTKTLIPSGTLCSAGGDSYLYGINYLSGSANSTPAFGTLDIVKLSGGGTAGLQVVQKDGKIYVRTPSFDKPPGVTTPMQIFTRVLPGFRTWRQIPINY